MNSSGFSHVFNPFFFFDTKQGLRRMSASCGILTGQIDQGSFHTSFSAPLRYNPHMHPSGGVCIETLSPQPSLDEHRPAH